IFFHLQGDGIQRANQQSIFSYCAACLEQWVIGSGFKFCFQIVDNAKAADITCEIKSPQRLYGENLSSTQAPKMHPITPPLGETIC
ncbi:hypothetical protein, partial [Pseudoalteromonas distincta]|uniref:hypothetical protein n=1 Tax=Pseudoalteromonas distincta TaxID=77608 RepID=UPI0034E8A854